MDRNGNALHGVGDAYYNSNGHPVKPEDIMIDGQGNLIDQRRNPVLDSNGNSINVRGVDLNAKV